MDTLLVSLEGATSTENRYGKAIPPHQPKLFGKFKRTFCMLCLIYHGHCSSFVANILVTISCAHLHLYLMAVQVLPKEMQYFLYISSDL